MSGAAYRDGDAGLLERRAALIAERRVQEQKLAVVKRVYANRVARLFVGACASCAAATLLLLDQFAPSIVAAPYGNTALGHALLVAPLVALVGALYAAPRTARVRPFEESEDARADVERLRGDGGVAEAALRATRLERASFVAPMLALAIWAPLGLVHAFIELGGAAAIRTYEMLPGGALRTMGTVEAFENMLAGVALVTLIGTAGLAFAVWRTAGRGFPEPSGNAPSGGAFVGVIMLAATVTQLVSAGVGDGPAAVGACYAALGVTLAGAAFALRATMTSARMLVARERQALA